MHTYIHKPEPYVYIHNKQIYIHAYIHTCTSRERETDRQTDRQIDRE
jgi:hypothetical protein